MCDNLGVDPLVAAKVMVAVVSNESGLTLTFERPTEANVALALQPTIASKESGVLKIVSSDVGESSIKEVVQKSEISMLGLTGDTISDEFQRSTENRIIAAIPHGINGRDYSQTDACDGLYRSAESSTV